MLYMIRRRQLLFSLGTIGTATALSGCTGQDPQDESETNTDPESHTDSDADSETDPDDEAVANSLDGISVSDITLTYNFSSGLRARIELRNRMEDEARSVNVRIAAYDGDQLLGDASLWEDFSAGYVREVSLTIESIGSLADHDIDEVTRFAITGRFEGEDPVTIREFDGETLRERVDTEE